MTVDIDACRGLRDIYANGASLALLTGCICDALGYPNAAALREAATVHESPSCLRDRDRTHGAARYALEVIAFAHGKRGMARRRALSPLPLALEAIGLAARYEGGS